MVQAWRNVRALRELEAWDAWLYRLTVRACYRAAKTVNRRAVVELRNTGEISDEVMRRVEHDLDLEVSRLDY